MSGSHGALRSSNLFVAADSPIHRMAAPAKLAGLVGFVVVMALTPPRWVAALTIDAAIVAAVVALARLPARSVISRLGAITPFIAFALFPPFIGTGPRVHVAGVAWSIDGLWAAWGIIAKATIGATSAIIVTATTPLAELLDGLRTLRAPAVVVSIIAVMLRYVDVVVDELARTRRAMVARGHDPRWLWQVRPIASSIGARFVRSYERGERVHLAMLARGYDSSLPSLVSSASDRSGDRHVAAAWALLPALFAIAGLGVSAGFHSVGS